MPSVNGTREHSIHRSLIGRISTFATFDVIRLDQLESFGNGPLYLWIIPIWIIRTVYANMVSRLL
jgi:hypothetical protein